jgi:biotin carboxyl carrier protein
MSAPTCCGSGSWTQVVLEPEEGAHTDPITTAENLKTAIVANLRELLALIAPRRAAPRGTFAAISDNRIPVLAPLVGTFYEAASRGADPFVREGDEVEAGQTVGIVEAMKLMNPIVADEGAWSPRSS